MSLTPFRGGVANRLYRRNGLHSIQKARPMARLFSFRSVIAPLPHETLLRKFPRGPHGTALLSLPGQIHCTNRCRILSIFRRPHFPAGKWGLFVFSEEGSLRKK